MKKECDKLLAEKKESGISSVTTGSGSLRHLTEEAFEDAVMDDSVIDSLVILAMIFWPMFLVCLIITYNWQKLLLVFQDIP